MALVLNIATFIAQITGKKKSTKDIDGLDHEQKGE